MDFALDYVGSRQEATSLSLSGLLAIVTGPLERLWLSDEEARLRDLFLRACEDFGGRLLESDDLDDLDDRLDDMLRAPAFHALNVELSGAMLLGRVALPKGPPAGLGRALAERNLPALPVVREGDRYEHAAAAVLLDLVGGLTSDQRDSLARDMAQSKPLDFIMDPAVPPEVSRGLLGSLRASACLYAFGAMLRGHGRPERWLVLALAERRRDGIREYLRVLASIPGTRVPGDVLSPEERFDWRAVHARNELGRFRVADLLNDDPRPFDPSLE